MTGRSDGEAAVFQVVEAIFVAVLVASALIFFALVQKPTPSPAGAGLDLARVAGDSLSVLLGDDPATSQLKDKVEELLPTADAGEKAAVRTMVASTLPEGLRFLLRATVLTTTGPDSETVYGPSDVAADPRNGQGAVAYILDADAVPGGALVLVELVVWNAF